MKRTTTLILLAALVAPACAFAQTGQGPAAPIAPLPKMAPKQQVGLPGVRTQKRAPSMKNWNLADANKKKGAQTASVQKAGPAVPPPPRIKVPKTKAPQTQTAERKKSPRVNAASMIAGTVRQQTRN